MEEEKHKLNLFSNVTFHVRLQITCSKCGKPQEFIKDDIINEFKFIREFIDYSYRYGWTAIDKDTVLCPYCAGELND